MTLEEELIFSYCEDHSYEDNYRRWHEMNKEERFRYNQHEYTEEESKKVFDSQYRHFLSRVFS